MRLSSPFVKLPLSFDSGKLEEEIAQFGEEEWRAHPQRFEGNSSLVLASTGGGENDSFLGPIKPSARLERTPYIRQVLGAFNSVIGRSRLMRLAPGAMVDPHFDGHYYWRDHVRVHIPIITDSHVDFYCDSEVVQMAAGEAWVFDNWRPHMVKNGSENIRIHLVFDTVGSAKLWKMIDGQDHSHRRIEFVAGANPALYFEEFPGQPVMPVSELAADLTFLIEDIEESAPDVTELKCWLRSAARDFVHNWHSHWMLHGPDAKGYPGYRGLLGAFREKIESVPDTVKLSSNGYEFKTAAGYTVDAALMPQHFVNADQRVPAMVAGMAKRPRFDRPVFIVAAPRSGSTLLFETLAVNRELWTVGDESHKHFESIAALQPNAHNPSNRLTAQMATPDVVETLLNNFTADLVNADGKPFVQLPPSARPTELRLLEKTPKNSLRIPFILKAFPEARFIFLYRDAKQNISSLLDSWRSQGFVTYPRLPGWPAGKLWSHLLIPGWEALKSSSLAEVTARQWLVTNQIILDDLAELPPERWTAIEYDALLADTPNELKRLCDFAELIFGPRMQEVATSPLKSSKYTLTAPQPGKWKKNAAELAPVLPGTEAMMARLRALL